MKRLNKTSHHLIALAMSLVIFSTGILLGVKLSSATQEGMTTIIFALGFLTIAILFILFTQLTHIRESLAQLHVDHKKGKGGS